MTVIADEQNGGKEQEQRLSDPGLLVDNEVPSGIIYGQTTLASL